MADSYCCNGADVVIVIECSSFNMNFTRRPTQYMVVLYRHEGNTRTPITSTFGPFTIYEDILGRIDRLTVNCGELKPYANLSEGLAAAHTCFDKYEKTEHTLDLQDRLNLEKYCILMCHSPLYMVSVSKCQAYAGKTVAELAKLFHERNIKLSIISPRKSLMLLELFMKADGHQNTKIRSYARHSNHMVLVKGLVMPGCIPAEEKENMGGLPRGYEMRTQRELQWKVLQQRQLEEAAKHKRDEERRRERERQLDEVLKEMSPTQWHRHIHIIRDTRTSEHSVIQEQQLSLEYIGAAEETQVVPAEPEQLAAAQAFHEYYHRQSYANSNHTQNIWMKQPRYLTAAPSTHRLPEQPREPGFRGSEQGAIEHDTEITHMEFDSPNSSDN